MGERVGIESEGGIECGAESGGGIGESEGEAEAQRGSGSVGRSDKHTRCRPQLAHAAQQSTACLGALVVLLHLDCAQQPEQQDSSTSTLPTWVRWSCCFTSTSRPLTHRPSQEEAPPAFSTSSARGATWGWTEGGEQVPVMSLHMWCVDMCLGWVASKLARPMHALVRQPPAVGQPAAQWHAQCSRSRSAVRTTCAHDMHPPRTAGAAWPWWREKSRW